MLRSELSAQERPSLDGMAEEVLTRGRRARRARLAKIASTVFVAAGVIAVVVAVPATSQGHATATPAAKPASSGKPAAPTSSTGASPPAAANPSSAAALLTSTITPVGYIPESPGPKAPTTAAAVLDELLKLLPPGTTSGYALYNDQTQTGAQVNLEGAAGLGMIRIFLYRDSLEKTCTSYDQGDISQACSTLPSGAPVVITKIPGNCIESLAIDVDHGQGTVVQIDVSTCLAWNGQANPPAHQAITTPQALRIAANPAWGAREMDAATVQDAARRFADVSAGS